MDYLGTQSTSWECVNSAAGHEFTYMRHSLSLLVFIMIICLRLWMNAGIHKVTVHWATTAETILAEDEEFYLSRSSNTLRRSKADGMKRYTKMMSLPCSISNSPTLSLTLNPTSDLTKITVVIPQLTCMGGITTTYGPTLTQVYLRWLFGSSSWI